MIFKSNDDSYDAMRWSLFDWVFDFGKKFNKSLQHLHKRNLAVVLVTIKYLLQVIGQWALFRIGYNPRESIEFIKFDKRLSSKEKSAPMKPMPF